MSFTAYELHHDDADVEGFLRLLPLHAAFSAAHRRQARTVWYLLGMQDYMYWHEHRKDILRMMVVDAHVRPLPSRRVLKFIRVLLV